MQIGIVSEKRHAKTLTNVIEEAGHKPVLLGGDPNVRIPPRIKVIALRTVSCSHGASDTVMAWKRAQEDHTLVNANSRGLLVEGLKANGLWGRLHGQEANAAILLAIEQGHGTYGEILAAEPRLSHITKQGFWSRISTLKKQGKIHNTAAKRGGGGQSRARYAPGPEPAQTPPAPKRSIVTEASAPKKQPTVSVESTPTVASRVADLEEWIELLQEANGKLRETVSVQGQQINELINTVNAQYKRIDAQRQHIDVLASTVEDHDARLGEIPLSPNQALPQRADHKLLIQELRDAGFKGSLTLDL